MYRLNFLLAACGAFGTAGSMVLCADGMGLAAIAVAGDVPAPFEAVVSDSPLVAARNCSVRFLRRRSTLQAAASLRFRLIVR